MTLARIGRFQVERMLGTGSFATVWLARDEDLDAWVAIKLLAENWSLNEDARRRFLEEARALRRLDHDRIVRVYEVGRLPDDRPYMVMEYADRGSLEERMRLRAQLDQPFSVREAVDLGVEVAECLASVHDLRIVHRDVKPSNILFRSLPKERQEAMRREGRPVAAERTLLGDFGIARRLEGILGPTKVVGSPQYMPPEQGDPERARLVDARSDVYSAAVLLYEVLTGRVPDRSSPVGEGPAGPGPRVETLRPDVPGPLAEAIHRALAADPEARFASAREWRSALAGAMEVLPEDDGAPTGTMAAPAAVTTIPLPSEAGPRGGTTAPAATGRHTAVLPDEHALPPRAPTAPRRRPGAEPPPALGVRPFAAGLIVAGLAMAVGLLLPVSANRTLGGLSAAVGSLSVTAGAAVAVGATALLLSGVWLWRTARRWAGRLASFLGLVGGLAGMATAAWVAVAELLGPGAAGAEVGLFVIAGAGVVGALAASAAARRLRPPLPTVPVTGR